LAKQRTKAAARSQVPEENRAGDSLLSEWTRRLNYKKILSRAISGGSYEILERNRSGANRLAYLAHGTTVFLPISLMIPLSPAK
jgi:hypothetical protein